MPWKEQLIMGQKIEFVESVEKGEPIAKACRRFGISRVTGHKWMDRFREQGYEGLDEESRRPKGTPLGTAEDVVMAVLQARESYPRWGPRKLVEVLRRKFRDKTPSSRTIARVLRKANKIQSRKRLRPLNVVERAPQVEAHHPNDVWTVDFKGWWRTQDGDRCDPLTVRDAKSRFVLAVIICKPDIKSVRAVFAELFRKYGVPRFIQCDNGVPFIAVRARAGLTSLSAWWISLGIALMRSRMGCPQDNGGHERMHRDVRADVQSTPAANIVAQQRALDKWRHQFNSVRPHEALKGKTPSAIYTVPTKRKFTRKTAVYPIDRELVFVSSKGIVRFRGTSYFLSLAVAGFEVALELIDGLRIRAWFYQVDLGTIDIEPDVDDVVYANFRPHKKLRPSQIA
jgi:putative transposase